MLIGFLQFKPRFGEVGENISRIKNLLNNKNFDLMVLPELSNSGYLFNSKEELNNYSENIPDGPFCSSLKEISSSKQAYIVSGICEKFGKDFYNSAVLVKPNGEIIKYRKIQLFYEEKFWFTPGDIPLATHEITGNNFGKVNIGLMICFDWIFPEVTRTLALKGAQIICHPSNLVLPYCQDAMVTRAIENHVFTITTNRTGKEINGGKELNFTGMSEICSPKGEILYKSGKETEECKVIEINPGDALDKFVNKHNNVITDRREEFYFK